MSYTKPFLKWAGGKGKLVVEIAKRLPKKWSGSYFEPFIGSGAVFFFLNSTSKRIFEVHLGDTNKDLMNAYEMVAAMPDQLLKLLRAHEQAHSKKHYYWVRDAFPKTNLTQAARFIYLNRTCFNGLYRVNKAGKFNVPMGKYKNPTICDTKTVTAASEALQGVNLHEQTFHDTIAGAMRGDFIYCDPPYLPKSETAEFTSYTKDGFTLGDHQQLHEELKKADKRGAKWMLSEGDSPFIRKLFKNYNVMSVKSRHSVAASGDSRAVSKELLITNYREFATWPAIG